MAEVKKVLEDAQTDLENANFVLGFISNPVRSFVLQPALGLATNVVPAVAEHVPFADPIAAFSLSIPFNVCRFGYGLLTPHRAKITTILEDAEQHVDALGKKMDVELRKLDSELKESEKSIDGKIKADVIAVRGYVIAATVELFTNPSERMSEWKHAADRLETYLRSSGIQRDLDKATLTPRFINNMRIVGAIQSIFDPVGERREETRLGPESAPFSTGLKEVAKLMRYCTASYGKDMMEAQEVLSGSQHHSLLEDDALPIDAKKGEINKEALELGSASLKQKVCDHVGIPTDWVLYFMLGYGGSMKLLRHYICVDHDLEAIVFCIRGTQSWSGWNIDAQGMGKPFCNGIAHAGMSDMATALMLNSKGEILKALGQFPNYRLIITGQSLGSGVACLFNILCHTDQDVGKHDVECHAYGGNPVYHPGTPHPYVDQAIKNCVLYVHREDCVPHLSVKSVHSMIAKLVAVDKVTKKMSMTDQNLTAAGRKKPTPALVEAVKYGDASLPNVKGAPKLMHPASCIVWFMGEDDVPGTTHAKYNMMQCDAKKFADLGILVSKDMFSDHPPYTYETCFNEMETIGWEVLGRT